jgi:hypothetical protein
MARVWPIALVLGALARPALAGPPYISDDPEPTDTGHFEIYAFNQGTVTRSGTSGMGGVDFNYGAAPDLQLTAMLPAGFNNPAGEPTSIGMTNIELAAKYRFLHQDTFGLDVSFFPRVFLPSGSNSIGYSRAGLLLPIWVQKDWGGGWSAFGGGGCMVGGLGSEDLPGRRRADLPTAAEAPDRRGVLSPNGGQGGDTGNVKHRRRRTPRPERQLPSAGLRQSRRRKQQRNKSVFLVCLDPLHILTRYHERPR